MDRTSILGDTIEYMKDLLEKIHNLNPDSNSLNLMGVSQLSQAKYPTKVLFLSIYIYHIHNA